jgi:hypothetical protein
VGVRAQSKPDYGVEAALLARTMRAPVRMQWTREDDLRHGYLHTVSAQQLVAGLDGKGRVVAWRHRSAFPSIALVQPNDESVEADPAALLRDVIRLGEEERSRSTNSVVTRPERTVIRSRHGATVSARDLGRASRALARERTDSSGLREGARAEGGPAATLGLAVR